MNDHNLSAYTPSELIMARSEAFTRSDFGFIFESYHSDSNFRRQFIEREDYLEFGRASLGQDFQILHCQVLMERQNEAEAQVVFLMEMKVYGEVQKFAELAWLQVENASWRYHRGQKMTHDELPEDPQTLTFADFAKLNPSTIF